MAIPDRLENKEAIEAAKTEILAEIAKANGKLDVGVLAKAIKSIQKGNATASVNTSSTTVNISNVDTSKCILIVNNTRTNGEEINLDWRLYSNYITFYHGSVSLSYNTDAWYWQVVEFY